MSNLKGWSFFLIWVGAMTATMAGGLLLAFMVMWTMVDMLESSLGETLTAVLVGGLFGALVGAGAGLGQALVLRPYGVSPGRWLGRTALAGAVGAAIGLTVAFSAGLMDNNTPEIVAALFIGFSVGLPIALAQWQILKRSIAQAQIWIPICTAAFVIGFAGGLPLGGEDTGWLALIAISLFTSVISGAGMLMLARGGETAVAA
jgi:hypothetical protein